MEPANARRLLRDEGIAAQGMARRVILAAVISFRIEGPGGGDDQFFLVASSGVSKLSAKVPSWSRCCGGML